MLHASNTRPPKDDATTPSNWFQLRGGPPEASAGPDGGAAVPPDGPGAAGATTSVCGDGAEAAGRGWFSVAARRCTRPRTAASARAAGTVAATIGGGTGRAAP